MPGDEEKNVSGRRLQQGVQIPNEERSAPKQVNEIRRADPLLAKLVAGVLIVTLPATSVAVAPTDAFKNSTNRINNGETMPRQAQAEQPAHVTVTVNDYQAVESRLASDPNFDMDAFERSLGRIERFDDQETVLHQVRRFFRDLDLLAAGQSPERDFLRNFGPDSLAAIVEDYKGIIAEGKEQELEFFKLRVIAIFANAYNAEQLYSDALPGTLTSAFDGATADVARLTETAPAEVSPQQRSWLASIPIIGPLLFGGTQVVPTPVEAPPETVTVSEHVAFSLEDSSTGATVTMTDSQVQTALGAVGLDEGALAELSAPPTANESIFLYFLDEFNSQMESLAASSGAVTLAQIELARSAAIASTVAYGAANFQNGEVKDERGNPIDFTQAQQAGFTHLGSLIIGALLIGASALADRAGRAEYYINREATKDLQTILNNADTIAQENVNKATEAESRTQTAESRALTTRDSLRTTLDNLIGQQAQARRESPALTDRITEVRAQLATAETALTEARAAHATAEQNLQTAKAAAQAWRGTVFRDGILEALRTVRTMQLPEVAEGEPAPSRIRTFLDNQLQRAGMTDAAARQAEIDRILGYQNEPWRIARLDRLLSSQYSSNMRVSIPTEGTNAGKYVVGIADDSAFTRIIVEPLRQIVTADAGLGTWARIRTGLRDVAATPYRIMRASAAEIARGGAGIAWGIAGIAAMLELGWEFEYWTGITDVRSPLSHLINEERPWLKRGWLFGTPAAATTTAPGTTAQAPAHRLTPQQETTRQSIENFADLTNRLGNTYRNLREALDIYKQSVLGTTSRAYTPTTTPDNLSQFHAERIPAATEFLNSFETSTSGMSADQAALEFYRQYFTSIAPQNAQGERVSRLVGLIDTYIPESERLSVYQALFAKVALKNKTSPVTDEAALFAGLYKESPQLREALAPILAVVDARFGYEEGTSANATITNAVASTYLANLGLSIAFRTTLQQQASGVAPDTEDVAMALARTYVLSNPNIPDINKRIEGFTQEDGTRVPGFFSEVSTQLEAYRKVLAYMAEHPNAGQDEVISNVLLAMVPANRRSAAMGILQISTAEIEVGAAVQRESLARARTILEGRERGTELLNFIDASLEDESDRLAAYSSLIQYFTSNPDYANAGYVQLKEQFLVAQFANYSDIRSAIEVFFSGPELDTALAYAIGLIKDAASEPGVRRGGPTQADVANLLIKQLVDQNRSLRNDLDALYIGEPARRRGEFDMNRFTMLLDAALFVKQTAGATSDQLHTHFIDEFNALYPGLDTSTVLPERQFDLVLTLLPIRDNSGAFLSEDAMLGIANSPQYWSYRTADWVRGQYESLNATDKARMFSFLPEELQREFWNGMSQTERGAVWTTTAASGDTVTRDSISAWKAAHQFIKRQNIGTRRRARQGYPDWPEETPAE